MDGIKRRIKNSLRFRLSLWLSLAILSVALLAAIFAFWSAFYEAHELQDDVLRQVATLFDRQHLSVPTNMDASSDTDSDVESHVFVQLLSVSPASRLSTASTASLPLPQNLHEGMQTVGVGKDTYRVMVRTLRGGQRLAVAQDTAVRDEIAQNSALRTLMPFLVLAPILLLMVRVLLRKIFKPVADLAIEIDQRDEHELHPLAPKNLPTEIRPFVDAMNRHLARVQQAMDAQRRFVADAAHELRSPLTALSLQAERLADTEMSASAQERLVTLRQGILRGRTLLDQLLALARAQASALTAYTAVSVQQVYRHVLEDLLPLAEVKHIDVGVVSNLDAQVYANEVDLITLVKNLVDNAIRYTPLGGRVDLSVSSSHGVTTLMIEDNGPGIPEEEWERVFHPFYRVLGSDETGSGLGLSIAQTISARIGAKLNLGFVNDQTRSGLRVTVTFPVANMISQPPLSA
jgi:two-component system OmpR family sensor kinase